MRSRWARVTITIALTAAACLAGCRNSPLEPPPPAPGEVCVWIGGQLICYQG
jgi:hypothetical protein